MPKVLRSVWGLVALVSWGLLLLGTLSQGQEAAWLPAPWPRWALLLVQAVFAAGVFMAVRGQASALRGHNFLGALRRLFQRALGFTLGLVVVWLNEWVLASRTALLPGNALSAVSYTVALGLFLLLLAQTLYTWRALVNFRGGPRLRREWDVFELLLGGVLLFQLLAVGAPHLVQVALLAGVGVYGLYLCGHQRWVTFLSQGQKTKAVLLQLGVLGFLVLFLLYMRRAQAHPGLLVPDTQQSFLELASWFAVVYAVAGLLVTLFNLPVADVFEKRQAEILSLQQLSQIIQRGQSAQEIYQALLTSAAQTVVADAAWVQVPPADPDALAVAGATVPTSAGYQLSTGQGERLVATVRELLPVETTQTLLLNDLGKVPQLWYLTPAYQSAAVLPLRTATHDYGQLLILKQEIDGFTGEDESILHTFATQTVLSLENLQLAQEARHNQRTQDELRIAALVQEQMIPRSLPTDNWFEISTYAQAAKEVGGDFYDFLHLPGQRLAVLIGDVSGKGVTAAFHTAQMKGIFHALMQPNPLAKNERQRYPDPHRFMVQANEALTHCLERSSFITAAFYIIDYEAGGFSFARAGHCHTLYYHSIKEEVSYFRTEGMGLGIIRNSSYEKHVKTQFWDYNPGDVMVIYTDGIVEARDGHENEYGEDRLREMLEQCFHQSATEINNVIRQDVLDFSRGQPLHDDQTLLVIKFKASQPQA